MKQIDKTVLMRAIESTGDPCAIKAAKVMQRQIERLEQKLRFYELDSQYCRHRLMKEGKKRDLTTANIR